MFTASRRILLLRLQIQIMKLKIEFDCDNAAFDDLGTEVARILTVVADKAQAGYQYGVCADINGNRVGEWELSDDNE